VAKGTLLRQRGGAWQVRFNQVRFDSDWNGFSSDIANTNAYNTTTNSGAKDGMSFNGNIGIGQSSIIILSQDN
jgi:hypothetical protein